MESESGGSKSRARERERERVIWARERGTSKWSKREREGE